MAIKGGVVQSGGMVNVSTDEFHVVKGIIVLPHYEAILPLMVRLRLSDQEMYEYLCSLEFAEWEVTLSNSERLLLPILCVLEKEFRYQHPDELKSVRLCELAIEYGMAYKIYIQQRLDSRSGIRRLSVIRDMYRVTWLPDVVEEVINKDVAVDKSILMYAMNGVLDDTTMEMEVSYGDGEGHIESDTLQRWNVEKEINRYQQRRGMTHESNN